MKTKILALICLIGVIIPMSGHAQTNVQRAFNDLLKSSDVQYSERHSLQKDTETGIKESQFDEYNFTLPLSKYKLVENILKAFKTDADKAYQFSSGKGEKNRGQLSLAVGDGSASTPVINPPGYDYYYACYLAPKEEDKTGNYRYAYAISWKKSKDKVEGSLIISYATTLKFRQNAAQSQLRYITTTTTTVPASNWFTTMVAYLNALSNDSSNASSQAALAAKIYKQAQLSQSVKENNEEDKAVVRELLKTLISETNKFDKLTIQLLTSSLSCIK